MSTVLDAMDSWRKPDDKVLKYSNGLIIQLWPISMTHTTVWYGRALRATADLRLLLSADYGPYFDEYTAARDIYLKNEDTLGE